MTSVTKIQLVAASFCISCTYSCGEDAPFKWIEGDTNGTLSRLCSPINILVDETKDKVFYLQVGTAADSWNKYFTKKPFTLVTKGLPAGLEQVYVTEMGPTLEKEYPDVLGLAYANNNVDEDCIKGGRIILRKNIGPIRIHVLEHELGHILGLAHNNQPDCKMYEMADNFTKICPEEIEYLKQFE